MPGMHGNYTAVTSMQHADLLIALGTRFDDRVTGKLASFAPHAKIVHVDIDPSEIGKNRKADVGIVGNAKHVIRQLIEEWKRAQPEQPDSRPWKAQLRDWQQRFPLRYPDESSNGQLLPQHVVDTIGKVTGGDAIFASGVGQHQMFASQYIKFQQAEQLDQLRRRRRDGLRSPGRNGGQGRSSGRGRVGHRRRRLLPDDVPGARHDDHREHPDQDRDPQQRLPRHGPPMAGALLRRTIQRHLPQARTAPTT